MKKKAWEEINVTEEDLTTFDLPDKYKCFAYHYVMDSEKGRFNGENAARKAGYGPKGAHVQSTRMLKNVKLKEFIGFITMQQLKPLKDKFRSNIIELGLAIISAQTEDYITEDGAPAFTDWSEVDSRPVKNIIKTPGKFGDKIQIELHDKKEWTQILDKYMDLAEKADITVKIEKESDFKEASDQDLETYLASVKERTE